MACVKTIDGLLPQTQCGECGFAGCLPYAEAMVQGIAPIDRCPPGGKETIVALAQELGINAEPFLPNAQIRPPALASIREEECIGCTKCIQACPVEAIVGSAKQMHAIIEQECTGCGLCVDPCPVDCIDMVPLEKAVYDKSLARQQFNQKKARLVRQDEEKQRLYREKRKLAVQLTDNQQDNQAKQVYILQALARVQAKKPHE